MTQRHTQRDTIRLERHYPVPPATVFQAWASPKSKTAWFTNDSPGWTKSVHTMDFRVGGREYLSVAPASGETHEMSAVYHDIVPNERIVWSFEMRIAGAPLSVSVSSVELSPSSTGTKLVLTEQILCLDSDPDLTPRVKGTESLLSLLEQYLQGAPASV
jgi:uncharacterized protein YndB with AHSA1/START domain